MLNTDLKDPFLKTRALTEVEIINKSDGTLTERIYSIPYSPQENLSSLLEFYDTRKTLITK